MKTKEILFTISLLAAQSISYAEMYQWKDENGNFVFSDKSRVQKKNVSGLISDAGKLPPHSSEGASDNVRYTGDITSVKILYLLRSHQFDQLNGLLQSLIDATKKDVLKEKELFAAFDTFESVDASYGKYFDQWLDVHPVNQVPYLARAKYLYRRAMSERGGNGPVRQKSLNSKQCMKC